MTVDMQERIYGKGECDRWVRGWSGEMSAQQCRQHLLQNGHFWRQVWTWHTEQWDIVKLLPDLFTSFTNWTLKPCSFFIYLLLLAKFCPFDAICLVMISLELSNLKHILNDECYTDKKWLQIMFRVLHLNVNQTAIHTCFFVYHVYINWDLWAAPKV